MRGRALGVGVSDNLAVSAIGVLVSLEEFKQDDLLPRVIHVVQDSVRAEAGTVLCGELGDDHLAFESLDALALLARIAA